MALVAPGASEEGAGAEGLAGLGVHPGPAAGGAEIEEWASEHRRDARICVCPMMEASPCDGLR